MFNLLICHLKKAFFLLDLVLLILVPRSTLAIFQLTSVVQLIQQSLSMNTKFESPEIAQSTMLNVSDGLQ